MIIGRIKKSKGSVVELLTAGICVIAMSVIVMSYLNSVELIHKRAEISQLARKYILRMETVGCLQSGDREGLLRELDSLGVKNISLYGTTMNEVGYGSTITLCIGGIIQGKDTETGTGLLNISFRDNLFEFREERMTTAKN